MPPEKEDKWGICWVSMASSDMPKYCVGEQCQLWNKSKHAPACAMQSMSTISFYVMSLVKFLTWGGYWARKRLKTVVSDAVDEGGDG